MLFSSKDSSNYTEGSSFYDKGFIGEFFAKISFGASERATFYRQIARFIENGVSEINAAKQAAKVYSEFRSLSFYQYLFGKISYNFEYRKMHISDTIKSLIPQEEYFLLKSTDGVDVNVKISSYLTAAEMAEKKAKLQKAFKSSAMKSGVLILGLMALIFSLSLKLIPTLKESIEEKFWDSSFVVLVDFSEFMLSYWWLVLLIFIGISAAIAYMLPRTQIGFRDAADRFFPFSVYKSFSSAGFLQSVSSMKKAGSSFSHAASKLQPQANEYTNSFIKKMIAAKASGSSDGLALKESGFFDDKTSADLVIYSESQSLDEALASVADASLDNAATRVAAVLGRFDFIIMVFIGFFILWLVSSVMNTVMNIG